MIANLITKFFSLILSILSTIINLVLTPLNLLVTGLLPDLSSWVTSIDNFINLWIPKISYFISWIGPFTLSVIRLEMSLISIFFTIYAAYLVYHTTIYLLHKFKIIN